ncbi:MAG: hypothetical protein ACRDPQ_07360 [Nocardioidaceae bacterium]
MDRRWWMVAAVLVATAACGSENTSADGRDNPMTRDSAPVPSLAAKHDSMEVSPQRVRPGGQLALRFPDHQMRGIAFALDVWEDGGWQTRFHLTSDGGNLNWTPTSWTADDAEGRAVPDIGVAGPGPDHVVIPESAEPGSYRLCTANALEEACALVTVVS